MLHRNTGTGYNCYIQFFMYSFGFSPFGIHTINPSLCVANKSLLLKPSLSDLRTKYPSCFQNIPKKLWCKIISAWTFIVFHVFKGSRCFFQRYFSFNIINFLICYCWNFISNFFSFTIFNSLFFIELLIKFANFNADFFFISYFFSLVYVCS